MHDKGLFLTPEQAVGSINSEGASLDLPATARRAVEATLWLRPRWDASRAAQEIH